MRPIQKSLLIHTITYVKETEDEWGKKTKEETIVEKVRVEPKKFYIQRADGDKLVNGDLIFWDNYYSTPCEFEPKQKIIFNGEEKTIEKIDWLYDRSKLHHLEIKVI